MRPGEYFYTYSIFNYYPCYVTMEVATPIMEVATPITVEFTNLMLYDVDLQAQ